MSHLRFDVFLSYNSEDAVPVERLAVHLADKAGLRPWLDKWELIPGQPWQRELERGLLASRTCAVLVGRSGRGPWQEMEVEAALRSQVAQKDRGFRVIPVLLPGAPADAPDLPLFLQGNTWVRFRSHDDDEALWRLECGIEGRPPGRGRPAPPPPRPAPVPHVDPRDPPGGAIDTEARYYVQRQADEDVLRAVRRPRGLVTVRGARQSGKTSLILRTMQAVERTESDLKAVFVDLQGLRREDFESLDTLWHAVAEQLGRQLALDEETPWEGSKPYDRNVDRILDSLVERGHRLLLCLDEVDRALRLKIRSELFASIRAFYNRGAYDRSWKQVSWLLGTSSEPAFFLENLDESPFNVGLRAVLAPFTEKEIASFAGRFGLGPKIADPDRILGYVGGQPYLTHLLLYHLNHGETDPTQLFDVTTAAKSVFREHLHRFLHHFQQDERLAEAMRQVLAGKDCDDVRLADRLEGAGLVRRSDRKLLPLCQLYAEFFLTEL